MRTKILYEDENLIVAHKPPGIGVQTAHIGQQDMVSELKNYLAQKQPYLGVIHRLDQPVEGILVFAKTKKVAADLSQQIKGMDFNKEYIAVVCGKPPSGKKRLVDYLEKCGSKAKVHDQADENNAKRAALQYEVISQKETEKGSISLLRILLETGRFHQIRAQLSHSGHPILGDSKYANSESRIISEELNIRNVALCANKLAFMHPISKKKMEYNTSPDNPVFKYFNELF
mgnify:FL=1